MSVEWENHTLRSTLVAREADGVTPAGFSRERIRGALRGGHLMKEAAR